MKLIVAGLEDSGKGLKLSVIFENLVYRNAKYLQMGCNPRPIVSVLPLTPRAIEWAASLHVQVIDWSKRTDIIEMLETLQSCDLILDEVGTYFDSRTYHLLPLSTRLWLAQAQKLGVHIWGGAQDWGQIDVSFRRLVGAIYEVKKVFGTRRPSKTLPAGKYRFAVSVKWRLVPNSNSDLADTKPMSIVPVPIFMLPKDMERFDTNSRVLETDPPPLKKIVQICPEDGYRRTRYI